MSAYLDPDMLRLYAVTADGAYAHPRIKQRLRAWLEAGVRTIQLRDKNARPADLIEFGRFLRAITSEYGAYLIVNDDPHLAALLGADGVHLGQEDMDLRSARKIVGPGRIVGLSTHDRRQVLAASRSGADYLGVGPIYPSATKDVGRLLLGPEFAGWAASVSRAPVVAIGGITLDNAPELVAAGCRNAAVVSALNAAEAPGETARAFLEILNFPDSANLR